MKVLVTGASGLIGSALCDSLLSRGDEVVGLTRDPGKTAAASPRIEWKAWEPTLERPPAAAFDGVEAVVNLVGETIAQRWTEEAKRRIMESRRTATRNLVGAIVGLERRPGTLVSQSAVGFYGDRGDDALGEDASPGSGFDAEVVREWEAAAEEAEAVGLRLALTRTGQVLDPRGGLLAQLLLPFRLGLGGPIAGGEQYLSWIHRDDEVALLRWVLDEERAHGIINATAPNPVRNREFARALGTVLGRPALLPLPGFALDLKFGRELGAILRGGQRVEPRRALELGFQFAHPELGEALRDLLDD